MAILRKKVALWQVLLPLVLVLSFIGLTAESCSDQTTASNNNATTAASKWGNSPNITNYYEYLQEKQIYEARDNPKLVLNAYLYSEQTGQLTCLGKVKGYGVPYGTSWSQPNGGGSQGSIPEPNALYPSTSTNADWILLVDQNGNTHLTFAEPNLIITDQVLPCTPLKG